jgi:outer membrane lipoprotein-sorting protein
MIPGTKQQGWNERLRAAQTVTFLARTWLGGFEDEDQPPSGLLPGQAFAVKVRRPGSLRIEEIRADLVMVEAIRQARCSMRTPFNVFVSDGTHQCELCVTSHVYIADKAAPTLSQIKAKYGLPQMIAVDILFAEKPMHRFRPIGEEEWEGAVVVYESRDRSAFKRFLRRDQRKQRLYIAKEIGLPVRLAVFRPGTANAGEEVLRTEFADWEFDVHLPDSTFAHPSARYETGAVPAPLVRSGSKGGNGACAIGHHRLVWKACLPGRV